MAGALIVTAAIAAPEFAWLDGLRRVHFPPERNRVPAHLTLFHALPPSAEAEVKARIARVVRRKVPAAMLAGLMDLGGGVAFRVVSDELDEVREQLATDFHGLLSAQDSGGWKPHITIQNKAAPEAARSLKASLERSFAPRPLAVSGLALHRYVGGPWEPVAAYPFRT